jgi:hypothetical protein
VGHLLLFSFVFLLDFFFLKFLMVGFFLLHFLFPLFLLLCLGMQLFFEICEFFFFAWRMIEVAGVAFAAVAF